MSYVKSGKIRHALDGINPDRAGIKPFNIHRCKRDEEGILFQLIQILQHFQEGDVLRHADLV